MGMSFVGEMNMTRVEEIRKLINSLEKEKQEYFWNYFGKMPEKILEKVIQIYENYLH